MLSKLDPAHIRVLNLLARRYPEGIQPEYRSDGDNNVVEFYDNESIDFIYLESKTFWDYNTLKNLLHEIRSFHHVKSTAASVNIWRKQKR